MQLNEANDFCRFESSLASLGKRSLAFRSGRRSLEAAALRRESRLVLSASDLGLNLRLPQREREKTKDAETACAGIQPWKPLQLETQVTIAPGTDASAYAPAAVRSPYSE